MEAQPYRFSVAFFAKIREKIIATEAQFSITQVGICQAKFCLYACFVRQAGLDKGVINVFLQIVVLAKSIMVPKNWTKG